MACQLLSFEGRPEAQAAVAAKLPVDTGRDQVEQALTTIIDQIRNIEVRLLHPWSADGAGSDHARERVPLLRISDVVAPLRELAPVLDTTQARSIPQRLDERFSYQAQFAVIAVLPRLAQLGFEDEAWEIASSLGDLRPLAVADLAAAGAGPASLAPEKTASGQQRADDPSLRALCPDRGDLIARRAESANCHRANPSGDTSRAAGSTSLRSEVISRLQPLIRSLPPDLRDPLIADLHKGDPELVSSTTDADEILLPLCDLLPDQILERRLSAIRSITLPAKIAEVMWRTSPQVPGRAPDDEAQPALLPCELVREALEAARTAERRTAPRSWCSSPPSSTKIAGLQHARSCHSAMRPGARSSYGGCQPPTSEGRQNSWRSAFAASSNRPTSVHLADSARSSTKLRQASHRGRIQRAS